MIKPRHFCNTHRFFDWEAEGNQESIRRVGQGCGGLWKCTSVLCWILCRFPMKEWKKKEGGKCPLPLNDELQEQSFQPYLKRIYMDEEEAVRGKSKWGCEMRMTWPREFLNPEVIASPKIKYSLDLAVPGVLRDESESSQTHPAETERSTQVACVWRTRVSGCLVGKGIKIQFWLHWF